MFTNTKMAMVRNFEVTPNKANLHCRENLKFRVKFFVVKICTSGKYAQNGSLICMINHYFVVVAIIIQNETPYGE